MEPGEQQFIALSLLNDSNCEELTFPYLFLDGKLGYFTELDVPLSPVEFVN